MSINSAKLLRSLLFVPANNRKLLESATRRAVDAIQLDLEDAIAIAEKDAARQSAVAAIGWLQGRCPYVVVRINFPLRLAIRDLEAVVLPGLNAVTVPMVPNASFLKLLDQTILELEMERGLDPESIALIALIETAEGLANINEIAMATPRLTALTIGSEDLAASLGSQAVPDALYTPNMMALAAARRAGIIPLGFVGSIALYDDLETYREWIGRAAMLGFEGAFCIHPSQVKLCNEIFQPSANEINKAKQLVEAFEIHAAQGLGVFAMDGKMVDAPVVERARTVLAKANLIGSRQ
ncbi:MAG: CoA ester lyase [SAR324 cluster bacterium]|nr:CoA ester lyase [SAR324 cluster bacterium]